MIALLENELKEWFDKSHLEGLYIVGSYSLGEQSDMSDVDFFGLSKRALSKSETFEHQTELKQRIKHILSPEQIGFRVRTIAEIHTFQQRFKSWGYDLHNAKRLFGIELTQILKDSETQDFDKKQILDNILEKQWYDLLYLKATGDQKEINYLSSKTILDILSFILYFNKVFISKSSERIQFLKRNLYLIDALPITINDFIEALNVKTKPNSYSKEIGLFEKRHKLLKALYNKYLPEFKNLEMEYAPSNYWAYDETLFKPIKEVSLNGISMSDFQNPNFAWRIILIHLFIELDSLQFKAQNPMSFRLKREKVESIFGTHIIPSFDDYDKELDSLLKNLENLRIRISRNGKDITKNISTLNI